MLKIHDHDPHACSGMTVDMVYKYEVLNNLYGLGSGERALYPRLVRIVDRGYDEVQQVHLGVLVQSRHCKQLSP